jgi:hypothetical protein
MKRTAIIVGEILLIATLYFVHTATDAPAVNEAHYLTKAKHYWHPDWCARDIFLSSADAHLSFYWTFGWLTKYCSLQQAAWTARIVAWLFLAATWWRLSQLFVARTGFALLTSALTIMLWDVADAAGEWVVGGIEGKVLAYGFVWLGLASLVRGHWARVWIYLGAASAFHALVGGWSVLAALIVWATERPGHRPRLPTMLPALAIGGTLALFGLWPALALEQEVDVSVTRRSHHIYVFFRLAHHLVFHHMRWWRIASHLALITLWIRLWRSQAAKMTRDHQRLHRFAAAAVAIGVCGILIGLASFLDAKRAASLLRFYWFRLSDVMVGVAATFIVVRWWLEQSTIDTKRAGRYAVATLLVLASYFGLRSVVRHRDGRPLEDTRSLVVRPTSIGRAHAEYADWRAMCDWVRNFTPADGLFLTPTPRQTFKWYAERAELVTRKDIPQDAASIAEWRGRMGIVGSLGLYREAMLPSEERLRSVTDHYQVDYVIVEKRYGRPAWRLPVVYRNSHFEVYRSGKRR